MTGSWMIDELAYAGPEHLDPGFIAGFDRKQGYPDPAEELAALGGRGLTEAATFVDLGAGTGRVARAAAPLCRRVVAADVSPAMVAHLRERAAAEGLANVETVQAGFLSYEHRGEPADVVFTRHALHQLPDFFKTIALDRIHGILRPGGTLRLVDLVYDFRPEEAEGVFAAWFAGASPDPAAGYTAEDYRQHIRSEFSTYRWLLEPMLEAAGFEIVDVSFRLRAFGSYTCVRR